MDDFDTQLQCEDVYRDEEHLEELDEQSVMMMLPKVKERLMISREMQEFLDSL